MIKTSVTYICDAEGCDKEITILGPCPPHPDGWIAVEKKQQWTTVQQCVCPIHFKLRKQDELL